MITIEESKVKQDLFIKQLKEGREQAYEALFKTYYTELVFHANRYLYDYDLSREIVQDLFVHIYEKRVQLDINQSLKAYLYRATQNRCLNYIQSQKTKDKYAGYVKDHALTFEDSIEKVMEANQLEHALYNAISELPAKCRMIFKMNRFDGLSNGEIADRLELSKRTVETQITRALKFLREKLQSHMTESVTV